MTERDPSTELDTKRGRAYAAAVHWRDRAEFFEREMDRLVGELRRARSDLELAKLVVQQYREKTFSEFEHATRSQPLGGPSSVSGGAAAPTLAGRVAGAAGGAPQAPANSPGGAPGGVAAVAALPGAPQVGDEAFDANGDKFRWEWDRQHDGFRWRRVIVKRTRDAMGRLLVRKS